VEELRGLDVDVTAGCVENVGEMRMAKGKKLASKLAILAMNKESIKDADHVALKIIVVQTAITFKTIHTQNKLYSLCYKAYFYQAMVCMIADAPDAKRK